MALLLAPGQKCTGRQASTSIIKSIQEFLKQFLKPAGCGHITFLVVFCIFYFLCFVFVLLLLEKRSLECHAIRVDFR